VEPSGAVLHVRHDEALMKAAQRLGYRWPTLCNGEGSCTICAIEVLDNPGGLTPLGAAESAALRFCHVSGRGDGPVRLACQARVTGDVVVRKKGVKQLHPPDEPSEKPLERTTMSNTEIVRKFLAGMETPITQVRSHLREYLTDDAEWGNCGFPPAIGIEDITSKHELTEKVFGDYKLHVQLLHIAEGADGVVFTERIDVGRTQEGEEILTVPVTGVFELRDGKISRWTDYFDPTGLLALLNSLPEIGAYFTGKTAASA
jgi:limonene-1,2-epoxide hydrolase/ferredoxin